MDFVSGFVLLYAQMNLKMASVTAYKSFLLMKD